MFQTSHPVSGVEFHDRTSELAELEAMVDRLRRGSTRWLALIGPRKIGKSSLVQELARRVGDIPVVAVDAQEVLPRALELARTIAIRTTDHLLGAELRGSLEVLLAAGEEPRAVFDPSPTFAGLPESVKTVLRALSQELTDERARLFFDLPERLAEALDRKLLIAIDEFQELASATRGADPLALIRSVWQRHRRVAYLVSGSGRTMLEDMVTHEHSPFFQHFTLMRIGSFGADEAVALLTVESADRQPIPEPIARKAVAILGGHPFYLQLLGEQLVASPPPHDDRALKEALQAVLFSRTGRLALYFEVGYDRAVGKSTYLAATLDALADGPARLTDVATRIAAGTADASRYLERLGDFVRRREDGRYELDDPVMGTWLRWRRPGGSVVPMSLIGDAAEREVATLLARLGFDLVYQSRASRGAFDLLATRGAIQLGIQVKRSALPLRFPRTAWQRMTADAKRLGWHWTVAAVSPSGEIELLDPARVTRGKELRLGRGAVIENVVAWLDATRRRRPRGR